MPVIVHQVYIKASINRCFNFARNLDIHTKTTAKTKEKAVGGVTRGLLVLSDVVTWEAVHFGIKQRLTAEIAEMDNPNKFVDVMVKGAFHSFTHKHSFREENQGTLMTEEFNFQSPFGMMRTIAYTLFLEEYMRGFIISRANELKKIAENRS
ncbi:SRPBCC family protein [Bacillus sp. DJP31]|uniref:SRPBCC family protein n=1 Tax=Bacillus sp. DJP31 TaxID=3409789 RepID=UPI003BB554AD